MLVEIPKDGDRTLTLEGGPIPGIEETATAWRVPVSLKPGEVRKLTAYIDRLEREQTALLADDAEVVVRLLNEQTLAPAARTALQRLAALRQDEAAKRATVAQLKAQQAAVQQDEDRHPPQPRRGRAQRRAARQADACAGRRRDEAGAAWSGDRPGHSRGRQGASGAGGGGVDAEAVIGRRTAD